MAEGEDRPSNFEDLFDDLDKFFQPDPTEQRQAGVEQAAAGPSEPAGDDILPEDWAAGVVDLGPDIEPVTAAGADESAGGDDEDGAEDDLGDGDDAMWRPGADEEPTDTPAASDAPAAGTEDRSDSEASEPEPEPELPAAEGPPVPGAPVGDASLPVPDRPLEHTAEMSTSDWRRLRDVLGDEEDASASSFEFSAETPEVTDESGIRVRRGRAPRRPGWLGHAVHRLAGRTPRAHAGGPQEGTARLPQPPRGGGNRWPRRRVRRGIWPSPVGTNAPSRMSPRRRARSRRTSAATSLRRRWGSTTTCCPTPSSRRARGPSRSASPKRSWPVRRGRSPPRARTCANPPRRGAVETCRWPWSPPWCLSLRPWSHWRWRRPCSPSWPASSCCTRRASCTAPCSGGATSPPPRSAS